MDLLIDACRTKNLEQLTRVFNGYSLDHCITLCVEHDFSEGLRFLLSEKSDTDHDYPHMKHAVRWDIYNVSVFFLEHGGDPNGGCDIFNKPLIFSVRNIKMAKLLVDHGVNINGLQPKFRNSRDYVLKLLKQKKFDLIHGLSEECNFNLHIVEPTGDNLLFETVNNKDVEGTRFLLDHGVENKPDCQGRTPLDFALFIDKNYPSVENSEIIKVIESYVNFLMINPSGERRLYASNIEPEYSSRKK